MAERARRVAEQCPILQRSLESTSFCARARHCGVAACNDFARGGKITVPAAVAPVLLAPSFANCARSCCRVAVIASGWCSNAEEAACTAAGALALAHGGHGRHRGSVRQCNCRGTCSVWRADSICQTRHTDSDTREGAQHDETHACVFAVCVCRYSRTRPMTMPTPSTASCCSSPERGTASCCTCLALCIPSL